MKARVSLFVCSFRDRVLLHVLLRPSFERRCCSLSLSRREKDGDSEFPAVLGVGPKRIDGVDITAQTTSALVSPKNGGDFSLTMIFIEEFSPSTCQCKKNVLSGQPAGFIHECVVHVVGPHTSRNYTRTGRSLHSHIQSGHVPRGCTCQCPY